MRWSGPDCPIPEPLIPVPLCTHVRLAESLLAGPGNCPSDATCLLRSMVDHLRQQTAPKPHLSTDPRCDVASTSHLQPWGDPRSRLWHRTVPQAACSSVSRRSCPRSRSLGRHAGQGRRQGHTGRLDPSGSRRIDPIRCPAPAPQHGLGRCHHLQRVLSLVPRPASDACRAGAHSPTGRSPALGLHSGNHRSRRCNDAASFTRCRTTVPSAHASPIVRTAGRGRLRGHRPASYSPDRVDPLAGADRRSSPLRSIVGGDRTRFEFECDSIDVAPRPVFAGFG